MINTYFKEIKIVEIKDREVIKKIAERHVYNPMPKIKSLVENASFVECHFLHEYVHLSLKAEGIYFLVKAEDMEKLISEHT